MVHTFFCEGSLKPGRDSFIGGGGGNAAQLGPHASDREVLKLQAAGRNSHRQLLHGVHQKVAQMSKTGSKAGPSPWHRKAPAEGEIRYCKSKFFIKSRLKDERNKKTPTEPEPATSTLTKTKIEKTIVHTTPKTDLEPVLRTEN